MKNKKWKIVLCSMTFLFSLVSAAISWGLVGDSIESFWLRFICGAFFNITPLLVMQMIIVMFRKEE